MQQDGRRTLGVGTRGTDPHRDRHPRPLDGPDHLFDVGIDRARRLHLQDQQGRAVVVGLADRVEDQRHVGRVEVPLDLHDVDAALARGLRVAAPAATSSASTASATTIASSATPRRIRCAMGTPVASVTMDLERFCAASRVVIVAGKGGVGKTTVTAALATAAARTGMSVLIVEVEGKSGLAACFGEAPLTYEEAELRPGVRARTLTPDDALLEYLDDHGMRRISRRLSRSGALDVVATAVPGMRDILVLGKVKQLERAGAADLILLDAPAAGHAVSFLLSARGLLDAVKVGAIQKQAADVVELLSDPARCRVILVTLPEETPVNELVDTAYAVEDRAGVALGPIVVNGCVSPLDVGGDVRGRRRRVRRHPRSGRGRTRWWRRPTSEPGWRGVRPSSARASPSACRSRSCACPSSSPPTSVRPRSNSSPTTSRSASPRSTTCRRDDVASPTSSNSGTS